MLAPGEALVRVRACALNHLDLWERRGLQQVRIPMPHISGSDVAGEVVSLGRGVDVAAGRRVMLQPGLSCGRCARVPVGPRQRVRRATRCSATRTAGGYAELVKVPVAEPDADSRRHRLRARGGVSADVPDRVAHADDARAAEARRGRAGARGRQRRRPGGDPDCASCTARACSPPPGRRQSWSARGRSARTRSSTTTSRTSPRRSSG